MTSWIQLHFPLQERDADGVEAALHELAAVSVTFSEGADQPIFEPELGTMQLWKTTKVTALFDAPADEAGDACNRAAEQTLQQLSQALELDRSDIRWEILADEAWERRWLEHFKPKQCGERLWIVPSAYEPPEPDAVNILLDPGLAFGTGTHPTTFLCLQWLDKHADAVQGKHLIDYGSGSGILAVAAACLGAASVIANDIDHQALEATEVNAERNNVSGKIVTTLVRSDEDDGLDGIAKLPADMVLANILAEPLLRLAPRLAALGHGPLVLSGILSEQAESIVERYCDVGMTFVQQSEHDGWVLLEFSP